MGLCEYRLNHKKKAYQIWMSLEQNPVELFVFVTEKIQNESTLLLPELMELFPNFRFLFYIAADRLLKVERLEAIIVIPNLMNIFYLYQVKEWKRLILAGM